MMIVQLSTGSPSLTCSTATAAAALALLALAVEAVHHRVAGPPHWSAR